MTSQLDRGFILVANHGSYLDWMVLHAIFRYRYGRHLVFFAKDRLFKHPLWGSLMTESGSIRVSDDGNAIMDRRGFHALQRRSLVAIFPEGTRSATSEVGRFHIGAAKLSARMTRPILPTTLVGFHKSWPRRRLFPIPTRCRIIFHQAQHQPPETIHDDELAEMQSLKIRKVVVSCLR